MTDLSGAIRQSFFGAKTKRDTTTVCASSYGLELTARARMAIEINVTFDDMTGLWEMAALDKNSEPTGPSQWSQQKSTVLGMASEHACATRGMVTVRSYSRTGALITTYYFNRGALQDVVLEEMR